MLRNILTFLLVTLCSLTVAAAEGMPGKASTAGTERLGTVSFPVSCAPHVQATFNKAVALLDSFQYDVSQRMFAEVALQDPQCAMAYWGQAMSLYHQLWAWPDANTLKRGREYIEKAQKLAAKSERERQYIHAGTIYYHNDPKLDDGARAAAYSNAMLVVHNRYPHDDNAAALYALSLVALRTPSKTERLSNQMAAIAILDKLFETEPDNPAAAHFLIHATDTPELAHLGLKAARAYAKIAPDSPHALHMPAHIFTDLGLWQESIDSNLASAAAAEKITNAHTDNDSGDQLHALSFLEYAYLQTGRDADARVTMEEIKNIPGTSPEDIANYQTMFQAEYLEETHQWKEAAALTPMPGSYPMMQVQAYTARAIGEARTGDVARARTDVENLRNSFASMQTAMKGMGMWDGGQHSGESLDQLEAEAWIAYAAGKPDEALAKMNAAVDRDGDSTRMGGMPGIPAREMLGDLLLELHQPAEAFAAYESALKASPDRFDSLYGAARAAQLAGNSAAANHYHTELTRICGPNADRPELQEARVSALDR